MANDLTDEEQAFCERTALHSENPSDAYRNSFHDAAQIPDRHLAALVTALLSRQRVKREIYFLQRLIAFGSPARLVLEYDVIRREAMRMGELDLAVHCIESKERLLGLMPKTVTSVAEEQTMRRAIAEGHDAHSELSLPSKAEIVH